MVKKTDLKTTITDIGNKIPNIASLVTTAVLNTEVTEILVLVYLIIVVFFNTVEFNRLIKVAEEVLWVKLILKNVFDLGDKKREKKRKK